MGKEFFKIIIIIILAYGVFLLIDNCVAKEKEPVTTKPIVVKPADDKKEPAKDEKKERKIPTLKKELRKEKE